MAQPFSSSSGTRVACRVLVVDDDEPTRTALAEVLEHEGFGVRTATDGAEALAVMRTEQPALVLLDLLMPDVDGFEVLRAKRDDATIAAIPVIALTAGRTAGLAIDAVVMAKPFDLDALLAAVRAALFGCAAASG